MSTKASLQRGESDSPKRNAGAQLRNNLATYPSNAQIHQLQAYQHMTQTSASAIQLKAMQNLMTQSTIQRIDEEEPVQAMLATVQKVKDEEPLKAKSDETNLNPATGSGLPRQLKSGIESLSGISMDHVKVHYNSDKPAQLNAHAYAQGNEIHVGPGQEQHLPHEAWHIVQQAQDRVKPTTQMKSGIPINDDAGLESEADVMGAKALVQSKDTPQISNTNQTNAIQAHASQTLQRMVSKDLGLGTEVQVSRYPTDRFRCYISARYSLDSGKYKVQVLKVGDSIQLVTILELTPEEITLPTQINEPLFSSIEDDTEDVFIVSSPETDESDHGAENDAGAEEQLIDWHELSDQGIQRSLQTTTPYGTGLLFNIFMQLVAYHCKKAGIDIPSSLPERFMAWLSGVKTRAQFKQIIGLTPGFNDNVTEIIQRARTPNTYSYNTDYTGDSNGFEYKNVVYYLDGDGNIDFKKNPSTIINAYNNATGNKIKASSIKWKYPVKDASEVQMSNDLKDKEQGIMPSGKKVKLKTASRPQHFAIADMLYPNSRAGTWTWHHLTPHYKMVLVDMKVHAKHGHNGGVHIWNK